MLEINMTDVISILKLCIPYFIFFLVVLVAAIIAMIAVKKRSKPKKYLIRSQSIVAIVLALVIATDLICLGPMSTIISLTAGTGVVTKQSAEKAQNLCESIADEGIVLLKNDSKLLPLNNNKKINVFGWASTDPCYGGTGSGALSESYPKVSLLSGLKNAGVTTNTELTNFYSSYCSQRPKSNGYVEQAYPLTEPPASTYSDKLMNDAKNFSDTAMIVITRVGGEGNDLPADVSAVPYKNPPKSKDFKPGEHILQLSQTEKDMVKLVCSNFDNVIFVYNGANTFELGFTKEYKQIKSVIYCPGTGQSGFNSLGKILTGAVNPSGKTSDTFLYNLKNSPAYNNMGSFTYNNMDQYKTDISAYLHTTGPESKPSPTFVNYTEGIYVGYRFYETAAKEGLINYNDTVEYPFGYGMSYTNFSQKMGKMQSDSNGNIKFDVTVTNTGSMAGKDIVEVYYDPPYTNGGIEKASANLIAFNKTKSLQPGESQTVNVSFKEEDMASFDTYGKGCYVLDAGNYGISIRSDSHTIIDEQNYTVKNTVTYDENNKRSSDKAAVKRQFSDVEGNVTYLSRKDRFANYKQATAAPSSFAMPDSEKAKFINNSVYKNVNNSSDKMPITGANNGMTLADLRGKSYDDPAWEKLLDQLTVKDMNNMIALGGYHTEAAPSVGKLSTVDCDGPASISNNFTRVSSIGFPSAVMIACTWNTDLADKFGESIGEMGSEMGVSGWYAPAMNIHRTALAGRNFEYYSEDGLISGEMAAKELIGAKRYGVYGYVKHFALNDQETNRNSMLCTWCNEQAMREIYLKPFEIAVKEGSANAVMISKNYIGAKWSGDNSALLKTVLRGEWGFQGFALTDYWPESGYGFMNADQAIRNGTDCCLSTYDVHTNYVKDTSSATSIIAMRNAAKNIMYTVVNSRAYDGANKQNGMLNWQVWLIGVNVLVAAALISMEFFVIRKGYKKRLTDSAAETHITE